MQPIRSVYEDDPEMMEIVREFAAELPQRIEELEGLLESGDMARLQTVAHQLKGAGGGYGFPQITDAAALLEEALKNGSDTSVVKDRFHTLGDVLRAVEVPEEA